MALTEKQKRFIEDVAACVQRHSGNYGIKVNSPIIAQAILESGWGESMLAAKYHNYFGLKCGTKWNGASVNMKTQEEYAPGAKTTITDNFRAYEGMDEGVKGYFEFIQLARYQNLKGIADPKTYLQTIKDDGYATSSTYVQDVFRCVTAYGLTKYDGKAGGTAMTENEMRQKPVDYLTQYAGCREGSDAHKAILAVFNDSGLCKRYKMTVKDAWCATSVSSAFIATGLADIFPCVECSCGSMIELAKKAGIWVENDAYVPKTGDAILYDWDDSGAGDCTGWPDHVGIVATVNGNMIRVVEGNISDTVGFRNIAVNARYIRGFITPRFSSKASSQGTAASTAPVVAAGKKSVAEIAKEVIAGKWGNGEDRKARLTAAGHDPDAVQKEVNSQVNGSAKAQKSVTDVAKEVLQGKWGNGADRRKRLEAAGYNYSMVQTEVNRIAR